MPSGTTFSKSRAPSGARRADGGDHGAGDPGDPADHRVLDQQHRPEDVVLAELHVGLSQRQQCSTEGGDGGGDAEGVHLGGHHADPERGGGPLVAAHGEQPDAGSAPTQVGDDQADEDEHDEHEAAVALRGARAGRGRGRRTTPRSIGRPRTPPVSALLVNSSELNISAMARVATARLVPRVRTAGLRHHDPDDRGACHRREQRGTRTASRWSTSAERRPTPRPRPGRTGTARAARRNRRPRRPTSR